MYMALLYLHSYIRWAVVLFALYLLIQAALRLSPQHIKRNMRMFTMLFDLQVLIGLGLYLFASPMMNHVFQNFGEAMKTPALRFWAVEHPFGMILSLGLIHFGSIRVKKAVEERQQVKSVLIFVGLGLVIMLLMTPWPFGANPRPLFR